MKRIFSVLVIGLLVVFYLMLPKSYAKGFKTDRFIYPEYSKTISMDFKNAALKDALKIFSQQSGLNFIASEGIADKEITLYLDNVPVELALEQILDANDLMYEMQPDSNIFIVKPVVKPSTELTTRVYNLKYATVKSSKLNSTISIDVEEEDGSNTNTYSSTSAGEEGAMTLTEALQTVLTEKGRIVENTRTNSLVITDIPSQFDIIEKTIAKLDVPVPQALIEVEMLDVSKNLADKIGIKPGDTPLTFTGAERDHVYPWNQNRLLNDGRFSFEGDEYRVGTIDASGLTAMLQMLRTDTNTKNLARPRILTLNNETAQIKILTKEAIGVKTQTSGADAITTSSVEAERVETGISLTVTPQINLIDNNITMAIAPKVIEARIGGTFSGTTFRDPEERGTKSVLRVHNGDTIILGGLLRKDHSNTITKVPVLGDIPVVGAAFRHKDKSDTDRELIVFITPHIVRDTLSTKNALAYNTQNLIYREQEIPEVRLKAIERALTVTENQRR